mgnify:CR=1 FL=1
MRTATPARLAETYHRMAIQDAVTAATYGCPECERRDRCRATFGRTYSDDCPYCAGTGTVTIDPAAIWDAIRVSRGTATGTLRRSRPAAPGDAGTPKFVYGAAYVHRMVRFAAGLDAHLPVMAGDCVGLPWVDPHRGEAGRVAAHLDALERVMGMKLFGLHGSARGLAMWGRVLGLPGWEELAALVDGEAGLPWGAGFDVLGPRTSPEAALEALLNDEEAGDLT